jgi:hypothetical protein
MATYPQDLDHPLSRGDLSLLGIGWREAHGSLWRAPYRGVHVWSATDGSAARQRALDASPLVPGDGALGGWAACAVARVDELDGQRGDALLPVPLCLPPQVVRRRGPTVVPWRSVLLPEDVTVVDGVRVTVPVRTAFDLARRGTLLDAVTALDVLARGRPEFLTAVRCYLEERPAWRGVPLARRALRLATPLARSPRETAFRLFWIFDCGLPTPEVNAVVRDRDGRLLGMGDLLDPESALLAEYDGEGHRAIGRHVADNAREEWLEDAGLVVVRASAPDVWPTNRGRTVLRLHTARRRGLARNRARDRWTWVPQRTVE